MDVTHQPTTFLKLASPFEAAAFVPTSDADGRPCTRAALGAAPVAYAEMERGGDGASDDSGAASGGDTVHLPDDLAPAQLVLEGGKEKKKVGRPITYRGDVNSKDLTEAERRRIKRRVANRESARRVRQKRQETMSEMQQRMEAMKQQIGSLSTHLQDVEMEQTTLLKQLETVRSKWSHAINENARLQGDGSGSFEPSGSSPSSNMDVDLGLPSISSMAAGPPQSPHDAPTAALVQMPHLGSGSTGAITSGAPLQPAAGMLSGTTTNVVPSFRPGVTITSVVAGFGSGGDGGRPQMQFAASPPPCAAAGDFVPQYQQQCYYQQQNYQVPQQAPQPQAEAPKMTTASSLGDPLNWLLNQPTLEPLPSLCWDELKGI